MRIYLPMNVINGSDGLNQITFDIESNSVDILSLVGCCYCYLPRKLFMKSI